MMQAVPRWSSNGEAIQAAYNEYVAKVGHCVIIAHSQGGQFAEQAAIDNPGKVKALIYLEPSGMPTPNNEILASVKNIPHLYIFGDFLDAYPTFSNRLEAAPNYYWNVKNYCERLKEFGGFADWIELPQIGIHGNTHMLMTDRNTLEIAALIQTWMTKKHLIFA